MTNEERRARKDAAYYSGPLRMDRLYRPDFDAEHLEFSAYIKDEKYVYHKMISALELTTSDWPRMRERLEAEARGAIGRAVA